MFLLFRCFSISKSLIIREESSEPPNGFIHCWSYLWRPFIFLEVICYQSQERVLKSLPNTELKNPFCAVSPRYFYPRMIQKVSLLSAGKYKCLLGNYRKDPLLLLCRRIHSFLKILKESTKPRDITWAYYINNNGSAAKRLRFGICRYFLLCLSQEGSLLASKREGIWKGPPKIHFYLHWKSYW